MKMQRLQLAALKNKRMKKYFPLLLLLSCFIVSCKFPEMKKIQLKHDFSFLQEKLKSPGEFESVGLSSNSNTTNGVNVNSITVTLLNGKNIPSNPDSLKSFAMGKAKIVADDIINPDNYASLTIDIKSEKKSGMITTTYNNPFSFSFKELEEFRPETDSIYSDSIRIHSIDLK